MPTNTPDEKPIIFGGRNAAQVVVGSPAQDAERQEEETCGQVPLTDLSQPECEGEQVDQSYEMTVSDSAHRHTGAEVEPR
jgi:hypothetical protein